MENKSEILKCECGKDYEIDPEWRELAEFSSYFRRRIKSCQSCFEIKSKVVAEKLFKILKEVDWNKINNEAN